MRRVAHMGSPPFVAFFAKNGLKSRNILTKLDVQGDITMAESLAWFVFWSLNLSIRVWNLKTDADRVRDHPESSNLISWHNFGLCSAEEWIIEKIYFKIQTSYGILKVFVMTWKVNSARLTFALAKVFYGGLALTGFAACLPETSFYRPLGVLPPSTTPKSLGRICFQDFFWL